jgi:hypothetical protein
MRITHRGQPYARLHERVLGRICRRAALCNQRTTSGAAKTHNAGRIRPIAVSANDRNRERCKSYFPLSRESATSAAAAIGMRAARDRADKQRRSASAGRWTDRKSVPMICA